MPENLQPPRVALRILSCFGGPHLPQILGDLMEEFNERVESSGFPAARRWYWRQILRNMIALAGRREMNGKVPPGALFLISGVWFGIALLWVWLTHSWLMESAHQAWGAATVMVLLAYFVLVIGWLVPLLWAFIGIGSASPLPRKHFR